MDRKIITLLLAAIIVTSSCKTRVEEEITIPELESILNHIATDSLKGRYPGTAEDMALANYLSSEMKLAGTELHSDEGIQYFEFNTGIDIPEVNSVSFGNSTYSYSNDGEFQPLGFSSNGTLSGEVIFAGNQNDLESMASILEKKGEGKWLMVTVEGDASTDDHEIFMQLRTSALQASDHKIGGIIFVSGSEEGIDLPAQSENKRLEIPIPAIMVSAALANEILSTNSLPEASELGKSLKPGELKETGISFKAITQVDVTTSPSFNTTVSIAGSDVNLSSEYIIIGAHHDHLGMGGSGTSSRRPDTIAVHYGADDNASGVAGVLELAEYIGSLKPFRSFEFLTFGGEEMGLLGSKHFVDQPTIELEKVQTMINLDMIGRLNEDRQIQIGGIGTSPVFRALIDTINQKYNFSLKYSEAGYGRSDHSSFYAKDIPVLFISTGAHTDYHTPSDNIEKINYEGLQEILYFVSDIAMELSNMPEKIEFTLAGPKTASSSRGRMGKISFGLMPDMTYEGNEGMPVTFVTEGKPAASAGMKGGDIIIAVDGKRVGNVYDYMERLGQLKEGQVVIVKIERDGDEMELLIQL